VIKQFELKAETIKATLKQLGRWLQMGFFASNEIPINRLHEIQVLLELDKNASRLSPPVMGYYADRSSQLYKKSNGNSYVTTESVALLVN